MLIGEYTHSFDDKFRVSLPRAFRAALGRKIILSRGLDHCLFVYSKAAWQKVMDRLESLSFAQADKRAFSRFILSGAMEVDVDSAGRILIPDHQRTFAHLEKAIVFAGVSDRVEIWDSARWAEYKTRIERDAETMAEALGGIGAL